MNLYEHKTENTIKWKRQQKGWYSATYINPTNWSEGILIDIKKEVNRWVVYTGRHFGKSFKKCSTEYRLTEWADLDSYAQAKKYVESIKSDLVPYMGKNTEIV